MRMPASLYIPEYQLRIFKQGEIFHVPVRIEYMDDFGARQCPFSGKRKRPPCRSSRTVLISRRMYGPLAPACRLTGTGSEGTT